MKKSSGKKLALVYDAIYPYIKGGGEKRFYEVGKRLSKKGYEVHFYGMKLWKGKNIIKKQGMFYRGICKAVPLYDNKKRTIKEAISFGIASFKLLKEDFDIIDCCGFPYFSLFSAKLVCIIKGKPLISTWHEVWGKEYWQSYIGKKGYLGYLVEKLASKLPNKIIAVSEHTKNKLINTLKVNPNKIITIPNALDFQKIKSIKPNKEKSDIIYAGRLLDYKNIDILIKSIKILAEKNPKIKCIIIGDGPEKNNLQKLTNQLNLKNNIIFKGFIEDYNQVLSLMKSSKVFVSTSSREGFGLVAIESNALGVPVITINHKDNAIKDLIQEGKNGYTTNLNEEGIADNILKAIKNSKNMKQNCINEAKQYDWNNITNKLMEVYR